MNLGKAQSEEVPYHARVYPPYKPIRVLNSRAEIRRAHIIAGTEEHQDYDRSILDHSGLCSYISRNEDYIYQKRWNIKDLKIFHIWNISLGKKPLSHWSVKFRPETNIIEVHEKNEHGTKLVDFILDTRECNKSLSLTVDDCEVNYSLFSDTHRVEFEIRPYDADGNPVLDVNGHVHAYVLLGQTVHEKFLLCGGNEGEKSEHVTASHALMLRDSTLIFPHGFSYFKLDVSLSGNAGQFRVKDFTKIPRRCIAIDEQHYILGEGGYVLLTIRWACLCVDQGVCVCPSGTAVGDIAVFQTNYDSNEDGSDSSEDSSNSSEDGSNDSEDGSNGSEDDSLRLSSSSSSQETTSNEEDSNDS